MLGNHAIEMSSQQLLSEEAVHARIQALKVQREAIDQAIHEYLVYLEFAKKIRINEQMIASCVQDKPLARSVQQHGSMQDEPALSSRERLNVQTREARPHRVQPLSKRFMGKAIVEAIYTYLKQSSEPRHCSEILQGLVKLGLLEEGDMTQKELNTKLWKLSHKEPQLKRLGSAYYQFVG